MSQGGWGLGIGLPILVFVSYFGYLQGLATFGLLGKFLDVPGGLGTGDWFPNLSFFSYFGYLQGLATGLVSQS